MQRARESIPKVNSDLIIHGDLSRHELAAKIIEHKSSITAIAIERKSFSPSRLLRSPATATGAQKTGRARPALITSVASYSLHAQSASLMRQTSAEQVQ